MEALLIKCRDLLAFHCENMGEDRERAEEVIQELNNVLGERARRDKWMSKDT